TRRAYEQERAGSPPDVVAAAVEQALTAEHPRARYPVGKNARIMTALPRLLPDGALDLIRVRLVGLPRGAVQAPIPSNSTSIMPSTSASSSQSRSGRRMWRAIT